MKIPSKTTRLTYATSLELTGDLRHKSTIPSRLTLNHVRLMGKDVKENPPILIALTCEMKP
ncbi:MAG: hypothetical protein QW238_05250 [Candidatus Bathyarchaeia archaeon]